MSYKITLKLLKGNLINYQTLHGYEAQNIVAVESDLVVMQNNHSRLEETIEETKAAIRALEKADK